MSGELDGSVGQITTAAEQPGSGTINREALVELKNECAAEFRRVLEGFHQPKKKIDDMTAGYRDGMQTIIMRLERLGVIKVVR